MKYLKYFEKDSDYQSFINSSNVELPNVSYTVDADMIYYNVEKKILTFIYENVTYEFVEGMTWKEWAKSDYNVLGFYLPGSGRVTNDPYLGREIQLNGKSVNATDKIIENATYKYSNFNISL